MKLSQFEHKSQTFYESFQSSAVEFTKAQISAFTGGLIDYVIMMVCYEVIETSLTNAIIIGGVIGAVVNFNINRFWTFKTNSQTISHQFFKFCFMAICSILLKAFGTTLLTAATNIDYKIIRLLVDALVCFGFNFVLQKYWVFKKKKKIT